MLSLAMATVLRTHKNIYSIDNFYQAYKRNCLNYFSPDSSFIYIKTLTG